MLTGPRPKSMPMQPQQPCALTVKFCTETHALTASLPAQKWVLFGVNSYSSKWSAPNEVWTSMAFLAGTQVMLAHKSVPRTSVLIIFRERRQKVVIIIIIKSVTVRKQKQKADLRHVCLFQFQ